MASHGSSDSVSYDYRAEVVRVIDGDTIDFDVDLGFHLSARIRVRLLGVNAPEIRGEQKEAGREIAARVRHWCELNPVVILCTVKTGKYGRWLGNISVGTESLNELVSHWIKELED